MSDQERYGWQPEPHQDPYAARPPGRRPQDPGSPEQTEPESGAPGTGRHRPPPGEAPGEYGVPERAEPEHPASDRAAGAQDPGQWQPAGWQRTGWHRAGGQQAGGAQPGGQQAGGPPTGGPPTRGEQFGEEQFGGPPTRGEQFRGPRTGGQQYGSWQPTAPGGTPYSEAPYQGYPGVPGRPGPAQPPPDAWQAVPPDQPAPPGTGPDAPAYTAYPAPPPDPRPGDAAYPADAGYPVDGAYPGAGYPADGTYPGEGMPAESDEPIAGTGTGTGSGPATGTEPAGSEGAFHTEQFAFVEDSDEQAEDVIDWLRFSESRAERRDERRRRVRHRMIALAVALVLVLGGGIGYLWHAGLLPGTGSDSAAAGGGPQRQVIVVHLRPVDSADSSTALLVRDRASGQGSMLLLPGNLSVDSDETTTTLARSVVDEGDEPTRQALGTLLGTAIQGTWRLDTPYLEILVDAVGGISLDSDTTIASGGRTLVSAGADQQLDGQAAVAYATYRAPGEGEAAQLARFGQVMRAVLAKMPGDAGTATKIVDEMGAIPDPSLSDSQLGAALAALSDLVRAGHYSITALPVRPDGTLDEQVAGPLVKSVLGGSIGASTAGGIPSVAVEDASTNRAAAGDARIAIVDSGYTYVGGGTLPPRAASQVRYAAASDEAAARQLARTLGLPAGEVRPGPATDGAQITLILGADYRPNG